MRSWRSRSIRRLVLGLSVAVCALFFDAPTVWASWNDPWPSAVQGHKDSVDARFPPPAGFERTVVAADSFAAWLRHLPLQPEGSRVRLYNGRLKANQSAQAAVLDIDVGQRDLQQCADAVIRLRAEYLWAAGCRDRIRFDFTSGDRATWPAWRDGARPRVDGAKVGWTQGAAPDASYASFRRYLDTVFSYAGTASLERELSSVARSSRIQPGDVFIQGGFPGHAVIVLDVAENEHGERRMLLAQSYMPAQEIHVLRRPGTDQPWYPARDEGVLGTPEWTFQYSDLRRFDPVDCSAFD